MPPACRFTSTPPPGSSPTARPRVALRMETAYPWEGRVRLAIEETGAAPVDTRAARARVVHGGEREGRNGNETAASERPTGYLHLERGWARGDVVELDLPMPARCVEAHPWIESTRGCVAIARGPLVYCLEEVDHAGTFLADLEIDTAAPLPSAWEPDRLDGVAVIRARGFEVDTSAWRHRLYRPLGSARRLTSGRWR